MPQISNHIVGIIPAIALCPGLTELINDLEQVLRYNKYSKKKKNLLFLFAVLFMFPTDVAVWPLVL